MPKKSIKQIAVPAEIAFNDLQKLAHMGTKEAVKKIEKYLKTEKDEGKRAYAEMALEECEFFFYNPTNEKEEVEFTLCELINRRERHIDDMLMKIENIEIEIEKLKLEKKVHEKVLAAHKNKQEEWKYNWMEDFVFMEENDAQKIKDELAYEEAWVAEAKKMITTARYKNMPARYFEHFDFDDGKDFDDDGDSCCDCGEV